MKAWVLQESGRISYEEREMPVPAENEVRIRVEAVGICGSDIPRIYETGAHRMPLIPGHEFSGVVESIGKNAHSYWLGKRVAVYPKIPCGKCRECMDGLYDMCTDYDYIGSRRDGAFAEYVTAPVDNLMVLPDEISFEQAAMIEPMAVAANAMRTGCWGKHSILTLDKPVAVCGAGTIGLMVVMFLKEAGFQRVYVIGNKDAQQKRAESLGIPKECFCDSRKNDPVKWLKEVSYGGVYSYFECVGSNESIRYGLNACTPGAWMILVGNPRTDMTFDRDTYWKILRNQMTIYGIWNSTFRQGEPLLNGEDTDDWGYVFRKLKEGKIHPEKLISHRFPLKELESGLLIMRDKTEDYCKVMIANK